MLSQLSRKGQRQKLIMVRKIVLDIPTLDIFVKIIAMREMDRLILVQAYDYLLINSTFDQSFRTRILSWIII